MNDAAGFAIAVLCGVLIGNSCNTGDVARLDHPLDPSAHLVRFDGDPAVWMCQPVTPTESADE